MKVFQQADGLQKPVIARNKDGLVDAVMNGKLGVLLDLDNVAEIAESLVIILTKRHPLGILHGPGRLRAEVIVTYSYQRFVETLAPHLVTFRFFSGDSRG
jgi:phosphatidyl-myo-inositol dimannoside synthase